MPSSNRPFVSRWLLAIDSGKKRGGGNYWGSGLWYHNACLADVWGGVGLAAVKTTRQCVIRPNEKWNLKQQELHIIA